MEPRGTQQIALFHESIEEAIATDVAAAGGAKKVGGLLRPDLTVDQAAGWVRACLNTERQERFAPGHVLRIKELARDAGSFATVQYESQRLGIEWKALAPAEAKKRVKRARVSALLAELARLTDDTD